MGTIKGTRMGRLDVPAMGICFHYYYAANSNQRDQLKRIRDLGYEVINTEESPVEPAASRGPLPPVMAQLLADGGLAEHFKKHGGFNL